MSVCLTNPGLVVLVFGKPQCWVVAHLSLSSVHQMLAGEGIPDFWLDTQRRRRRVRDSCDTASQICLVHSTVVRIASEKFDFLGIGG